MANWESLPRSYDPNNGEQNASANREAEAKFGGEERGLQAAEIHLLTNPHRFAAWQFSFVSAA